MRRSQRPVKLPTWRKDQEEESATMTPKPKKSTFDRRNDNNSEFQEISRSPQTKSTGKKSTGGRSNSSKRPNTKKSTAANPSASSSTSPKSPLGETHSNSYENYDYDAESQTPNQKSPQLSPSRSVAAYAMMAIASTGKKDNFTMARTGNPGSKGNDYECRTETETETKENTDDDFDRFGSSVSESARALAELTNAPVARFGSALDDISSSQSPSVRASMEGPVASVTSTSVGVQTTSSFDSREDHSGRQREGEEGDEMGKSSRKSSKRSKSKSSSKLKVKTNGTGQSSHGNNGVEYQHSHDFQFNPQYQAFLVEHNEDGSDSSDRSLGSLCERFMVMFRTTKPRGISLDDAAFKLGTEEDHLCMFISRQSMDFVCIMQFPKAGIERRRIYDVINILEAFDIVSRKEKNTYWWHGTCQLHLTLHELKEEAVKNRTHLLPSKKTRVSIHPFDDRQSNDLPEAFQMAATESFTQQDEQFCLEACTWGDDSPNGNDSSRGKSSRKRKSSGGTSSQFFDPDAFSGISSTGKTARLSERKENSMGCLARKFIQMFLLGRSFLSLEEAAALLSSPSNGTNAKHKTTVRRLYDIANVMCVLRIIEKVPVTNSRKPAYQWCGVANVPMLDGISRRAAATASDGELKLAHRKKKKSKETKEGCFAMTEQLEMVLSRIEASENNCRDKGVKLAIPEPRCAVSKVNSLRYFPRHAEVFGYENTSNIQSELPTRSNDEGCNRIHESESFGVANENNHHGEASSKENNEEEERNQPIESIAPMTFGSNMQCDDDDYFLQDVGMFGNMVVDDDDVYEDPFTSPYSDRDTSFGFGSSKHGAHRSPPPTVKASCPSNRVNHSCGFVSPQMRNIFTEKPINVENTESKRQKISHADIDASSEKNQIVHEGMVSMIAATVGGTTPIHKPQQISYPAAAKTPMDLTSPNPDITADKVVETPFGSNTGTPFNVHFNTPFADMSTPSAQSAQKRQAADARINALFDSACQSSHGGTEAATCESVRGPAHTDEPAGQYGATTKVKNTACTTATENPTGTKMSSSMASESTSTSYKDQQSMSSLQTHANNMLSKKGSSPCPATDLFSKFTEAAATQKLASAVSGAHLQETKEESTEITSGQNGVKSAAACELYDTEGFTIARRNAGSRASNYSTRSTSSDEE